MRHVVTMLVETTSGNKADIEASVVYHVVKSELVTKVYDVRVIKADEETVL